MWYGFKPCFISTFSAVYSRVPRGSKEAEGYENLLQNLGVIKYSIRKMTTPVSLRVQIYVMAIY
jgi:DNA-directed RNA polymerase subunit N (RpoN/RPB10)